MLAQELERAFARKLGRFGMVAAALIAVEAVPGLVIMRNRLRVCRSALFCRFGRNGLVGLAPVEHDRAFGLLGDQVRNRASIVRYRAGKTGQPGAGHPRRCAAEAVAHDADLADRLRVLDRGSDVGQGVFPFQALHDGDRRLDVGLGVAGFVVAPCTVEYRGSDDQETVGCVPVGDCPDMAVDTEDLLHHNKTATRLAGRLAAIGPECVAVGGFKFDHRSHLSSLFPRKCEVYCETQAILIHGPSLCFAETPWRSQVSAPLASRCLCRLTNQEKSKRPAPRPAATSSIIGMQRMNRSLPPTTRIKPSLNDMLASTAIVIEVTACVADRDPISCRRRLERVTASTSVSPEITATT